MNKNSGYSFEKFPEYFEKLKTKLRVAVIHGGDKNITGSVMYETHNPRSWKSYKIVANDITNALIDIGFNNVHIFPDDMTLLNNLNKEKIHICWLNTAGVQGYIPTSHASAMLEMTGIALTESIRAAVDIFSPDAMKSLS